MRDVSFGQYYPAESVIHRLDPRAKVVMSVLYIVCTFLCKNLSGFIVLVLSSLFLILLSRIPARLILRSMRSMPLEEAMSNNQYEIDLPGILPENIDKLATYLRKAAADAEQ